MNVRRTSLVLAFAALPVLAAACGGDDSADTTTPTTAAAVETAASSGSDGSSAPGAVELSEADVEFLQGMIPHHQQAIEMADVALGPSVGASADVLALAGRVKGAQDPEIRQMTAWLTAVGQPVDPEMGGHDMSNMDGMMSAEEMDALGAATGTEFDTMWLEMMIRHHEGAIAMADEVKANGSNAEVLGLADQIITAQQAEIAEMRGLIDG